MDQIISSIWNWLRGDGEGGDGGGEGGGGSGGSGGGGGGGERQAMARLYYKQDTPPHHVVRIFRSPAPPPPPQNQPEAAQTSGRHRHHRHHNCINIPATTVEHHQHRRPSPQAPQVKKAVVVSSGKAWMHSSITTSQGDDLVKLADYICNTYNYGNSCSNITRIGGYASSQRILLVGEGDFSFSASLALAFGSASNLFSTSLDSFEFLVRNYKRSMSNLQELKDRGCMVLHEIDATEMANNSLLCRVKYDRIIFNFPLAGFFGREVPRETQIRKNQVLLSKFMANAKKMIEEDGEIHITHKSYGFFRQWNLQVLGLSRGLWLIEEVNFKHTDYPGYHTKYGFGGDKDFDCSNSKTYKFRII